jgi:cation diffusion facilitator family transporter
MNASSATVNRAAANREKRWVALSSLLAAVLLTTLKLVVGLKTHSLGILAEAAHSALDLLAAAVTLWAVAVAALPADRDHTYGHGKFENLSALIETLLLLATCAWVVYEALHRLLFAAAVEVEPSVWAFGVVLFSIVVDISRSRALRRAADKHQSQALAADALHFSTDVWSSCVVLAGLCCVLAADRFQIPSLKVADPVAALGVALIVVSLSLKLGKQAVDDLLDRVPRGLQERVSAVAAGVPGVEQVRQVRLRRSGPEIFADVTLAVGRTTTFEKAHEISDQAADAVRTVLPEADVVVHAEPVAESQEDLTAMVRTLAAHHGMGAHAVRVYQREHERWFECHLEVDPSLSLEEAHGQATAFELELREKMPEIARVVTHLEPIGTAMAIPAEPASTAEIGTALAEFAASRGVGGTPHNIQVQWVGGELQLSCHCRLTGGTPIVDAHQFTVAAEEFLRSRIPNLGRVVIHVEPMKGE